MKLRVDQMMRKRNFKARNDVVERGSVTKSLKRKQSLECVFSGKHKDNVPKDTPVVSDMTLHWLLETAAGVREEKDDRLLPHHMQRQKRLTERNQKPFNDQAITRKTQKRTVKFHADSDSVKIRHVDSGILPCV